MLHQQEPEEQELLSFLRPPEDSEEQQEEVVAPPQGPPLDPQDQLLSFLKEGGGVIRPAPSLPRPSEGMAAGFDRLKAEGAGVSAAQFAAEGDPSSPFVQATQEASQSQAVGIAARFTPVVGGVLDIKSMLTDEREALAEGLKTHPLRTGLLIAARVGVDLLDVLPVFAAATVAPRLGLKAALGVGVRNIKSPLATRRLIREAMEEGSTVISAVEKGGKVVRIEGVGDDLASLAIGKKGRWVKVKKNEAGVKGFHADFAGPEGRTGTAAILRVNKKHWEATISLGPERITVGIFRTKASARQAISEMGADATRQVDALLATTRVEAGGAVNPMTRNGEVRARAAREGAKRSDNAMIKETMPTDAVIAQAGEIFEPALTRPGLLYRFRSVERVAAEATAVGRTALQDGTLETTNYFDDLIAFVADTGWLKRTRGGAWVVRNKALDTEIFDVLNGKVLLKNASPQAQKIIPRLQEDYLRRGLELKAIDVFKDMNLRNNYVTFLRESDEGTEILRTLFRTGTIQEALGKKVAMRFAYGRSGAEPTLQSAWDSVAAYHHVAIRAKHAQRALGSVDVMMDAAMAEGNTGLIWGISQVRAILLGKGHDPWLMDGEAIASIINFMSRGKRNPTSDEVVFTVARGMSNLFRALMYFRPGIAFDQLSQFPNLAAVVGGPATVRGIAAVAKGAATKKGLAAGAAKLASPITATGAVTGAVLGGIIGGPVGAAVGAALVPTARFVKGAVAQSIPKDVALRIGVADTTRLLRGSEFRRPHSIFMRHWDEAGFAQMDAVEVVLRGSSLSSGLEIAISRGLVRREAMDFAIQVNSRVQFLYDQFSRNPFFRHSVLGAVAAPLSSFAPKQSRFILSLLMEGGADGASPAHAYARYLFYNGIIAMAYREGTKAVLGEELVPRASQERVEPAFLESGGIDAPAGFQSIGAFSRSPGVDIADTVIKALKDGEFLEFIETFLTSVVPGGLAVNDAFRAKQRIESQVIRRQEGTVPAITGARVKPGDVLPTPGASFGGDRRPTTTTREVMRIFSFVSPEEAAQRDAERFVGMDLRDFNEAASKFLIDAERALRARDPRAFSRALAGPGGVRAQASGRSKLPALEAAQGFSTFKAFMGLPQGYRNLIGVKARGTTPEISEEIALKVQALQIESGKFARWVIIYQQMMKDDPARLKKIDTLHKDIRATLIVAPRDPLQ